MRAARRPGYKIAASRPCTRCRQAPRGLARRPQAFRAFCGLVPGGPADALTAACRLGPRRGQRAPAAGPSLRKRVRSRPQQGGLQLPVEGQLETLWDAHPRRAAPGRPRLQVPHLARAARAGRARGRHPLRARARAHPHLRRRALPAAAAARRRARRPTRPCGRGGGRGLAAARGRARPTAPARPASPGLNPKYTFEQFVIGEGNRMAHAAALAAAELPAQAYNPLFLHGPPGLGKTHLLHAIGSYVHRYGGGLRVRYATDRGVHERVRRRRPRATRTEGFKERLPRARTCVLIDDVQFLAGRTRTREEFFHTFNALLDSGRQLVLTSDRAARGASGPRGPALGALPLGPRGRARASRHRRPRGDPRQARPARRRRARPRRARRDRRGASPAASGRSRAPSSASSPTPPSADRSPRPRSSATSSAGSAGQPRRTPATSPTSSTPPRVSSGSNETALLARDRRPPVATARQVAMYLARELTDHSLPEIGRGVGGRNHTTVMHAINRVSGRAHRPCPARSRRQPAQTARPTRLMAAATATIHSLRRFRRQARSRAPAGSGPLVHFSTGPTTPSSVRKILKLTVSRETFLARLGVAVARRSTRSAIQTLAGVLIRVGGGPHRAPGHRHGAGLRVGLEPAIRPRRARPSCRAGCCWTWSARCPRTSSRSSTAAPSRTWRSRPARRGSTCGRCPPEDFPKLPEPPGGGRAHRPDPGVRGHDRPRGARGLAGRDAPAPDRRARHGERARAADGRHRLLPPGRQGDDAPRRSSTARSRRMCRPARSRSSAASPARAGPDTIGVAALENQVDLHRRRRGALVAARRGPLPELPAAAPGLVRARAAREPRGAARGRPPRRAAGAEERAAAPALHRGRARRLGADAGRGRGQRVAARPVRRARSSRSASTRSSSARASRARSPTSSPEADQPTPSRASSSRVTTAPAFATS